MKVSGDTGDKHEEVTAIFRRRVGQGVEQQFSDLCGEIAEASQSFEGYIGTELIQPTDSGGDHVAIVRFQNYAAFEAWNNSDRHKQAVEQLDSLTEGKVDWKIVQGIGYWFALGENPGQTWPPDWRMVLIAYVAIWPLVVVIRPLYSVYLPSPPILADSISTVVITVLMAYLTLPLCEKALKTWLFRKR